MKRAAVSYIKREDGRMLCVWNSRYGGWSLPGGMVEENETIEAAQARELKEETGLETVSAKPIYDGKHGITVDPDRASHVHIFRVVARGEPKEIELGHPVTWLTQEQFLKWSPFASFYITIFDVINALED